MFGFPQLQVSTKGRFCSRAEPPKILSKLELQEEKEDILVRVSDEGLGIPEEDIPYVFDTAYRSPSVGSVKRTGSGLGLAIAKRVVEQHGGTIKVQSKVGEGTTVSFNMPLYKPDL